MLIQACLFSVTELDFACGGNNTFFVEGHP